MIVYGRYTLDIADVIKLGVDGARVTLEGRDVGGVVSLDEHDGTVSFTMDIDDPDALEILNLGTIDGISFEPARPA